MLTESLLVVCTHLSFSATRFRRLPLLLSPFAFHPLPLLPKSLFTSFSPFCLAFPALPHPSIPSLPHLPFCNTHTHTPLCLPQLISSPRVRDQSGEGLAEGVIRGWSWEPGRVRSALSPRGERERERDNMQLPHASINAAPKRLHASFHMSSTYQDIQENTYRKSTQKNLHTDTNCFFPPSSLQKSQINAGTTRLCQSWQHRQ